jgi:hypothetical protein
LLGDFNLIYKAQDKNNGTTSSRLMMRFRRALSDMKAKEIELIGRKYTWSNNQSNPSLTRIDGGFVPLLERIRLLTLCCNHSLLPPLTIAPSSYNLYALLLSNQDLDSNHGGSVCLDFKTVLRKPGLKERVSVF